MLNRCENEQSHNFSRYGARGIKVLGVLREFSGFMKIMGKRPSSNHTLDRIDNDGYYEVGNVRWATAKQQAKNRRNKLSLSKVREIRSFRGIMLPSEVAPKYGVTRRTIHQIWAKETWNEFDRTAAAISYDCLPVRSSGN